MTHRSPSRTIITYSGKKRMHNVNQNNFNLYHYCGIKDIQRNQSNAPDSFVHASCFLISASETVGRTLLRLLKKSAILKGGSIKSSDSTSSHVFSTASGSPGEHGVHFRTSGSVDDRTRLKCVAEMTLRTGCMSASRTTMWISDPEYLSGGHQLLLVIHRKT